MNYIIGIDIGTQGIKGVIINEKMEVVAKGYVEHHYLQPRPNWYEHDAEKVWWGGFKKMVQELLGKVDFDSRNIIGVGFSGLAPCFLPVDENNKPLRNAILYGIDTRANKEIQYMYDKIGEEKLKIAQDMDSMLSVVKEGRICGELGVSYMHDITEGGIFGAVWEATKAIGKGIKIRGNSAGRLPVHRGLR